MRELLHSLRGLSASGHCMLPPRKSGIDAVDELHQRLMKGHMEASGVVASAFPVHKTIFSSADLGMNTANADHNTRIKGCVLMRTVFPKCWGLYSADFFELSPAD